MSSTGHRCLDDHLSALCFPIPHWVCRGQRDSQKDNQTSAPCPSPQAIQKAASDTPCQRSAIRNTTSTRLLNKSFSYNNFSCKYLDYNLIIFWYNFPVINFSVLNMWVLNVLNVNLSVIKVHILLNMLCFA